MHSISMERNLFVAEKFLSKNTEMNMANIRGINIDGGTCWYPPQVISVSKATTSHIHPYSAYEKSIIIERTMQYIKDRTTKNALMIIFNAKEKKCKLKHMINWLKLFVDFHNKELNLK